jgi:hypothetical protein
VDRTAEALWREQLPPFDGLTLATPELAIDRLHAAVARLVDLLRGMYPNAALQTAEDWHEHDGFVSEPEPGDWGALLLAVRSEESLRDSSPEDTDVRRAWLAEGAFYLRWLCFEEDDSVFESAAAAGGDLDLTAGREVIQEALRALREMGIDPEVEPAGEFFDRRWTG